MLHITSEAWRATILELRRGELRGLCGQASSGGELHAGPVWPVPNGFSFPMGAGSKPVPGQQGRRARGGAGALGRCALAPARNWETWLQGFLSFQKIDNLVNPQMPEMLQTSESSPCFLCKSLPTKTNQTHVIQPMTLICICLWLPAARFPNNLKADNCNPHLTTEE